ncbi:hypothetical protein SAMN04515656_107125 [Eubacterium aggregans]|uniref:Stage 0 sporulation protein A homolog n=1 Tax=Eubacterium aggregans TaxID=81409 RepID=A0A1H4A7H3_9FIRM|nr:hypothetical protein SAMN04515656_107125 [Eubacterium aggregans]
MKRKVLIVDDQSVNRKILNKILCDHYTILEASMVKTLWLFLKIKAQ